MDKPKEKFNQRQEVVNYLKLRQKKPYAPQHIAEWLLHTFPEEYQAKKNRSRKIKTDEQLIKQLIAEVGSVLYRSDWQQIRRTPDKPARFYWQEFSPPESSQLNNEDSMVTESCQHLLSAPCSKRASEKDLYPLLSEYLYNELKQYPKWINEKRSSNQRGKNGNRWLHPDMVSMEFLGENWHEEVNACVDVYTRRYTKLWSFEVKLVLHSSNVRESFFQTVSNSSWANFGYLVATEIKPHIIEELRMLSAAHGIGVIQLDTNNVSKSHILISSRERNEIDWSMVSRLVKENNDFLNYIKLVRHFYQTKRNIRPHDWDIPEVLSKQMNI